MSRQLDRLYRRLATGFAFTFLFGGGGLLAVTVLPLASLLPGDRRARAQSIIQRIFRFYLGMVQALRLLRIELLGQERLQSCRGAIIVANHPTLLDVVILMSLVPNAQCIVKNALWSHPFLGPLVRRAGYIRNDLDGESLIAAAAQALGSGGNMIVFPEGTRRSAGEATRLQRGFANIATMTGADVQLVWITCTPPMLMKGAPWWSIPEEPSVFRVTVDACIAADAYRALPRRTVASRHLTRYVESYFAEKLANV